MCFGIEQNHVYNVYVDLVSTRYVDLVSTFKYHFCLFQMELYQSGTGSYLIQIFKQTLKSWEFIVGNSLFHTVFTTLATFSPS